MSGFDPKTTRTWLVLALSSSSFVACGGAGEAAPQGPDAGNLVDSPRMDRVSQPHDAAKDSRDASKRDAVADAHEKYPAAHPPLPQVSSLGGPVLLHPRVIPIVYDDDPLLSDVQTFFTNLESAAYWEGAVGSYGVGAIEVGPTVLIHGPGPTRISTNAIPLLIAESLDRSLASSDAGAGDAAAEGGSSTRWPLPDGNTIYAVIYPPETTITDNKDCMSYGGYHDELAYSGGKTSYAVLPRCASFSLLPGHGALDILTVALSHELCEAATDPFPTSDPAYSTSNFVGSGWSANAVGGEIGDMCVLELSSYEMRADVGYWVQRVWSDANALASHDPCAPDLTGEVYFSAVPDLAQTEVFPGLYMDGITVAPGASATVALHLFSDGPTTGPWTVSVSEPTGAGGLEPYAPGQLVFSLDKTTGENGDTLALTVKRKALRPGSQASGLPVQIVSKLGATSHSYFAVVGY
jgi:hypothetical protein